MSTDLQETRLPGIGTKFTIRTGEGCRLAVILHNDGKRELYHFRRGTDDEPRSVITLDDDEARQLGAVLGGAYERPKIVEELEMALGELLIEWIAVPDSSPWIGKPSPRRASGRRRGSPSLRSFESPSRSPGRLPTDVIQQGDTLVTVGKAGSYAKFTRLLRQGDDVAPPPTD